MPVGKRQKLNDRIVFKKRKKKMKKEAKRDRRETEPEPLSEELSEDRWVEPQTEESDQEWAEHIWQLRLRQILEDHEASLREDASQPRSLSPASSTTSSRSSSSATRGVKRKASSREAASDSDSGSSSSFSPSSSSRGERKRRSSRKHTSSAIISSSSPSPARTRTRVVRRGRPFVRIIGKIYRFECEFGGGCEYACDRINNFNRHMDMHKGVTYNCSWCSTTLSSKGHLLRHIRAQHEGRFDYPCLHDDCDKEFKRLQMRNQHVTYDHDLMAWTCPTCQSQHKRKRACTVHIKNKKTTCSGEPVLEKRTDVE
jgi:hypothetical protein